MIKKQKTLNKYWPEIKCVVKNGGLSDGYQITALHYFGLIWKDADGFDFFVKGRIKKRGFSLQYRNPRCWLFFFRPKIKPKNAIYFWRFIVKWGDF